MKTSDFDYFLPEELIAQDPLAKRDGSRLLILNKKTGKIEHKNFYEILDYLDENDFLVINSTKVLPARLLGNKEDTGAKVEIFLLHPTKDEGVWECLVKPGKKVKIGTKVVFKEGILKGEILSRTDSGSRIVKFTHEGSFMEAINKIGEVPLPPYIKKR